MKKSFIIAGVIAVLAVLWIASGVLWPEHAVPNSKAPSPAQSDQEAPAEVRVRHLSAEMVTDDVAVTGRTQAVRSVEVAAEIEGLVSALMVEKGAAVEKDQILARLDIQDRQANLLEAQERMAQRRTEYEAARELTRKGFDSEIGLAQVRADYEAAQAAVKRAQIALDNTEIKAPFGGIVFDNMVEEGDYVAPGQSLFRLIDLHPIEVAAFVTEQQMLGLILGGPAMVKLVDGREVQGKVSYIAPAADPDTRTFRIEVQAKNSDHSFKEGMTATVIVPTTEKKAHKISPAILGLDDEGRIGVKSVDAQNIVHFMPVQILADRPGFMWVHGLPDNVQVITVGQDFVTPGQKVTPIHAADEDGLL